VPATRDTFCSDCWVLGTADRRAEQVCTPCMFQTLMWRKGCRGG
jgi:hypothetical protein